MKIPPKLNPILTFADYMEKQKEKQIDNRTQRIVERLEILGSISDDDKCVSRFFGTQAHIESRKVLIEWMKEAGMTVSCDNMGNIRGILASQNLDAKHFVVASHYDSVFDAGKYDGPLGILLGIEMAQKITDEQQSLPFHLDIVAFADEEGGRFNTAYLGSCVLAGNFDHSWLTRKDDNGTTLEEVINNAGGNIDSISQDSIPKEEWLGYFEIHIEQGPVLEKEDLPVCLVSGIAGQTRVDVKWTGMAGHAGTCPMDIRQDALCAAAEFTLAMEAMGKQHKDNLVATVGKLNVGPNTSNVVCGFVYNTLDIRSMDDAFLAKRVEEAEYIAMEIAKKRDIKCEWQIMQSNASVDCDSRLKEVLRRGITNSGVQRLLEIPSGAGHDGVMISRVAPISMLFVRCKGGISHNPLEYSSPIDIMASLEVCNQFLAELKTASEFNF